MLAAHLGKELLNIDIDLARRADVADFKAIRGEAVLDEAGFLSRSGPDARR